MDSDHQTLEFSDNVKHLCIVNYSQNKISHKEMRDLRELFYERCQRFEIPFRATMKIIDFADFPGRVYCYYCLSIEGCPNRFILPAHAKNSVRLVKGLVYFIEHLVARHLEGGSLEELVSLEQSNMHANDQDQLEDTLPTHFDADDLLKEAKDKGSDGSGPKK